MKWNDDDCESGVECGDPGLYEAEVIDVKQKSTKENSDEMWALRFKDVKTGKTICFDNLVFSTGGCGIAFTKLKHLGIVKGPDGYECQADDLVGLRADLILVVEEFKGKKKLVPDFSAENFGYKLADVPF